MPEEMTTYLQEVNAELSRIGKLCVFIEDHGFAAYHIFGKIHACMIYSRWDERTGEVTSFEQWETVEPTLSAVREWLGY